jgi:type II secretory ATPase GspE/PulE/Tfp pilus assembly ATPase PilB-like protein
MPAERERASTFTLAQQVRAILNQRLVRKLCQACSHKKTAGEVLNDVELGILGISADTNIRAHNTSGCDLCNRTGISGRTLLLDAILLTSGSGQRNDIYEALIHNVNDLLDEDGVVLHTRREGLVDLVVSGQIDPKASLSYLEE